MAIMANAANIIAILEIVPASEDIEVTISEFRHLTDELRTRARQTLPRNEYSILTRDNIIQLLPPDDAKECFDDNCAVEIGRAIGAEYVTQGFVGKFGEKLTLTVELYESMSGNLLGSFVTESDGIMGLLATVREKAPELFGQLSSLSEPEFSKLSVLPEYSEPQTINPIPQTQKSRSPMFIAIGLDVLGVAAVGFGVWQESEAKKFHKDYEALNGEDADYKGAQKKVENAVQKRNIAYIVGGTLLAAGIGVHIWF